MKKIFLFGSLFLSISVNAQSVISGAGTEHADFSGTLGEVVIGNTENQHIRSDQGFQQGILTVLSSVKEIESVFNIQVYPNPVSSILNINIGSEGIFNYFLYDLNGRFLSGSRFDQRSGSVDFTGYPTGQYVLKISREGKILQSFIILKKQ